MLLSLNGRRVYFDLAGPQGAPTVCFTHSLNADGGMWVEQMVPLLAAGYRVLRLDMRGHGGSAPVDGDYTMDALAADVKGALDVLDIKKVHYIGLSIGGMIGQGFALANPSYLLSLDALRHPAVDSARLGGDLGRAQGDGTDQGPGGAGRRHDGALVHRRVQESEPGALARDPRHDQRHHAARLGGLHVGDPELQLRGPPAHHQDPDPGDLRRRGRRARRPTATSSSPRRSRAAATKASPRRATCPTSSGRTSSTASCCRGWQPIAKASPWISPSPKSSSPSRTASPSCARGSTTSTG